MMGFYIVITNSIALLQLSLVYALFSLMWIANHHR